MHLWNVLVFPGGTEIGLEIWKSLNESKEINLFSAGRNESNHAPFVFTKHFYLPSVHENGWLEKLNGVIEKEKIHYVYPAHDEVILALTEKKDQLKCKAVLSPDETCRIARFKSATYRLLKGKIPVPQVYENVQKIEKYPVFVKPDRGQGSQQAYKIENSEELQLILKNGQQNLIMEYLPGEEYTVDCFSDREKGLLFCQSRERLRVRNGISVNSRLAKDQKSFQEYAHIISQRLVFHGAWFFQMKRDSAGVLKLLEVAPRIAGTMAYDRVLGINMALLSIYEQERIRFEIMPNSADLEIDRALISRYKHNLRYDKVYVDLDDTLIFRGAVNTNLVRFFYQCINKKIKLVLMTRHAGIPHETLKKYRLEGIFDEIIHLDKVMSKAEKILEKTSIFIDDSFRERKEVRVRIGIPTFDCSMIEMLLDERC
jgi:hypothetical protein